LFWSVFFAILFAACGSDKAPDSQPAAAPESQPAAPPESQPAASSESQPGYPPELQRLPTYGKGEAFSVSVGTYKLADVVFAPEYDSGDARGYGVVFLQKTKVCPSRSKMSTPN
jgi:hypothetical protein